MNLIKISISLVLQHIVNQFTLKNIYSDGQEILRHLSSLKVYY